MGRPFYTGLFFGIVYVLYCLYTFIFGAGFDWIYIAPFAFLLVFTVFASGEGNGELFNFLISANIPVFLIILLIFFINDKLGDDAKKKI